MKLTFDISATEFVIVRDILADIVPPGCRVWVFGSRAKNQARFNSDLDLALECKDKLPPIILHKLKEAFSDSPLPYRVDVLDINDVSENFQTIIRPQAIAFPLAKSTKVPKLRFKDAQGKEFPDWVEKRLGDFYEFKSTNSLSRDKLNYEGGKVRNIHYGDIHTKFKPAFDLQGEQVPFINSDVDLSRISEDKYCQHGDLVIADASEDYDDIGKTIELINLNNEKVLAGLHTLLARLTSKNIYIGFGTFVMACTSVRKQIKIIAQGTKVLGISAGRMANIKQPIPCPEEQQKITSFLSAINTKIAQITKKKALLEQYKRGVMQKLFSQELRFKDAQSKAFPDWVEKRLGEVANVYQPETLSQSQLDNGGEYLVYGANGVIGRLNRFNHEESQVAVTCRGNTCGQVTFTKPKSWITGNSMVVNLDTSKSVLKKYLYYDFKGTDWRYLITGSGQPQITGEIKKHKIKLPSRHEQQKIADFLSSIDQKIDLVATELDHANIFKKGLLHQMFI